MSYYETYIIRFHLPDKCLYKIGCSSHAPDRIKQVIRQHGWPAEVVMTSQKSESLMHTALNDYALYDSRIRSTEIFDLDLQLPGDTETGLEKARYYMLTPGAAYDAAMALIQRNKVYTATLKRAGHLLGELLDELKDRKITAAEYDRQAKRIFAASAEASTWYKRTNAHA